MDELHSVKGSARFLGGLSHHTIESWLSSGKLKRTKIGARTFIRQSELERIIQEGGKSPGRRRSAVEKG
jgi:hypothetical protein